jgi:mannosyl-oligosaccharide alpha-1,2-mannosidase
MPGNLLLGARYLKDENIEMFAEELMQSCYDIWNTPTGLAPETWSWIDKDQDMAVYPEVMQKMMTTSGFVVQETSYDLRPGKEVSITRKKLDSYGTFPHIFGHLETVESLFYFYRITGDKTYQVRLCSTHEFMF